MKKFLILGSLLTDTALASNHGHQTAETLSYFGMGLFAVLVLVWLFKK